MIFAMTRFRNVIATAENPPTGAILGAREQTPGSDRRYLEAAWAHEKNTACELS